MEILKDAILIFITFVFIVALIAVITALPIMLLWNWLMPVIFGLCEITFTQALGLACLSGLFFKTSANTKIESK